MKAKRILPLLLAAFYLGGGAAYADTVSGPYNVAWVQDPFFPGFVLQLTHSELDTVKQTTRTDSAQLSYGFSNSSTVAFFVPVVTTDSPESPAGASVPRTGGQGNGKPELDGYFRFWGDYANYIGIQLGITIPYESDPAVRNTAADRLVLPVTLLTRFGGSLLSVRFSFTDTWTFPSVTTSTKGVNTYNDQDSSFNFLTYLSLFPESRISPYFKWSETLSYSKDLGTDQEGSAFIEKTTLANEARSWALGLDTVPWKNTPLVLSAEADCKVLPMSQGQSPWSWAARGRWAF